MAVGKLQGARPSGRPRPAGGPATDLHVGAHRAGGLWASLGRQGDRPACCTCLLIFCLKTFETENVITSTYELRFR